MGAEGYYGKDGGINFQLGFWRGLMLRWKSLPTLAPLLQDRKLDLAVFCSAVLLLGLFAAGLPGWQCPFLHTLGIPCPGCGLTRATYFLLRGDVKQSLSYHAFAPFLAAGLVIIGSAGLLPERSRQPFIDKLIIIEQRTGIVLVLVAALFLYWLARLVLLNSAFLQLIRG